MQGLENISLLFRFHAVIVEVGIVGVAIYRPFGEFRRAKSYCHLYGAQGQRQAYPLPHATMNFVNLDLTTPDRCHSKQQQEESVATLYEMKHMIVNSEQTTHAKLGLSTWRAILNIGGGCYILQRGLLAMDLVISNHGQMTRTTPEQANPSPNFHNTPMGGRRSLDRFNMQWPPLNDKSSAALGGRGSRVV
ncbi:hypothetical protein TNCV_527931 [Trichonephila clavipes]|nr:hypothetical protein TNCV_527931 [Trichonephila clavipes]